MDPSLVEDAVLVERVLAGDKDAFGEFVVRYGDALRTIAHLTVRNVDDARDIVQQALFTAYLGLPELSEPARFGAWAKGIVSNLARKALEDRTRFQRFAERWPRPPSPVEAAEFVAGAEKAERIVQALNALDASHREIAALHYLEGLKIERISAIVNRPVGTIKRMLAEAGMPSLEVFGEKYHLWYDHVPDYALHG
jgi:RNA polymerase sigma-70 factor (ECF subfamily)